MSKIYQNKNNDININNNVIFNIPFYDGSKTTLIDQYVSRVIKIGREKIDSPELIFTPNPEQVMLAQTDARFAAALEEAHILLPDGVGIVIASKLLAMVGKGKALSGRVTGIDVMSEIIQTLPEVKKVVIGGKTAPGKASHSANLEILGQHLPWLSGYQDVAHPTIEEETAVEHFLVKEKPAIVFVAFGAPYQEYWSIRHKTLLAKHGVKVVLVVGGAADVLTGKLQRAPQLFQFLHLEWLYRLVQEPWRWRRQLSLVRFIKLTLTELVT